MPEFPLEQLTIRNGVLTLVAPPLPETPYLDMASVHVAAKDKLVELARGEVSYMFALDRIPDAAWSALFESYRDGLPAEIEGAQLDLRCTPAELETTYAKARELLARTNRAYAEQKAQLIARVTELDGERRETLRANDERLRALQAQFDRLVL